MSRRVVLIAAATPLLAAALVLLGRWERGHRADVENRAIGRFVAQIGPVAASHPDFFRYLPEFQCLLYARGNDPIGLEMCVDAHGRVVEAIDRRGHTRIWSLRDDPRRADVYVDRPAVDQWLLRLGLPRRYVELAHANG